VARIEAVEAALVWVVRQHTVTFAFAFAIIQKR